MSQPGTVTASNLNLRAEPSTERDPIGSLPRGTRLRIEERVGSWYRVTAGSREGWVHADYVLIDPEVAVAGFLHEDEGLRRVPLPPDPARLVPPGRPRNGPQRACAEGWNRTGGLVERLADSVGIRPAAAVAVLCVESSGRGFVGDRLVIRFENHIFWNEWGKRNEATYRERFRYDPTKRWTGHAFRSGPGAEWESPHRNQDSEWRALAVAMALHEVAALRSISMGASQIMGFNHPRIGYDSVRSMFDAFRADERFHILGMFDFIRGPGGNSSMLNALRLERYEQFATGYNGSGQAPVYGARIRTHVEAFDELSILPAVVAPMPVPVPLPG